MEQNDFLEKLEWIKSLSVATVDRHGKAQVRIIEMTLIEGLLYFVTARGKEFYRELLEKETVAVAGMGKDWKMVRMTAWVKPAGREYVDLLFEKNAGLAELYPGDSRRILDAFCVVSGHGELFDLSGEREKLLREEFSFGGADVVRKGFFITESCIFCGTCAKNCPRKCIRAGEPFLILRQNCLHCGLCAEVCPVQAVRRLEP